MIYNDVPHLSNIGKLVKFTSRPTFCISVRTIVSGLWICE